MATRRPTPSPKRRAKPVSRDGRRNSPAHDSAAVVLREVLDAIPYSVFWKDFDSTYLGCNRRFVKDAGKCDSSEIVGRNDYDMPWSREEADFYRKCDREVMESGTPLIGIEETQINASGEQTWLWTSKVPLRTPSGMVFGILGIYTDVTARKRIEQELVTARETAVRQLEYILTQQASLEERTKSLDAANAELNEIQRIMPGALLVLDSNARIRSANATSAALLGIPRPDALVGRCLCEFIAPADDGLPFQPSELTQARSATRREALLLASSGERVPVLISTSKLETAAEPLVVLIAIDLRDRKRLETELRQAQKLEAVGRLAAGIAHEINTPVQFVSDSVQFLRDSSNDLFGILNELRELRRVAVAGGPASAIEAAATSSLAAEEDADLSYLVESVPKAFDRCLDGLSRVATIVRSMKEFAHPDSNEMKSIDLNRAIESTLTIARNEYKYVADLVTEFGTLEPVRCHPGDLNQAVLNIVVNAAHAVAAAVEGTEQRGRITVRTKHENGHVVISVSDTGNGIPERIRERIFDPFFTTKDVGRGTGQGLTIARSIVVDKHHGSLDFETETGRGTTFFIRLPGDAK